MRPDCFFLHRVYFPKKTRSYYHSSIKLIIAQGTNDSLHYVVSTIGSSVPTLLLLKSNQEEARLAVDWDKLLSNSTDEVSLNGAVKLITKTGQQDHPLTAVYLFSQVTLQKLRKRILSCVLMMWYQRYCLECSRLLV